MQGDFRPAALFLCLLPLLGVHGCARRPAVVFEISGGELRVPVEVAATPESRSRGLMWRRDLDPGAGMLFVFPESSRHSFWMQNTPLPLDMIFIGEDLRVVGIIENTVPFSTTSVGVPEPSRYVLEVHGGFARRKQIERGTRVRFDRVPARVS